MAFKVAQGVTQGDPILPTIFNMVVDAAVRYCISVMAERAEELGGNGQEGRHKKPLFYSDNGMVTSLDPQCIQGFFITLVGLFDRVGLKTNARKAVVMVCCPCQAAGTQSEAAYGRRMTGAGNLH